MKPHAAGEGSVTAGAVPLMSNPKSEWLANLLLTLPFLILYWVDLAHHTLFFDELNAWAIAAASPTLPKLFHLVHYEGHPWLVVFPPLASALDLPMIPERCFGLWHL